METATKPQSDTPTESPRSVLRLVFSVTDSFPSPPIIRIPPAGMPLGRQVAKGVSLADPRLSRHHATFRVTDLGRLSVADQGSKNGTFVNGVRVERCDLNTGDVVSAGDTCLVVADEPAAEDGAGIPGLVGDSAVMRSVREQLRRLAPTKLFILLVAETGCGKEVAARALHALSGLPGPFVAVNCAAIPDNLFESQLFGHTAGSFTGAAAHPGFFRAAAGGTLFLDELGELPLAMQPKLLRALDEGAVVPLGATRPVQCAVRIIAATNRDLASEVERGTFRADLLARLFQAIVPLPPLRDRREDVLSIFAHALGGQLPGMTHAFVEAMLTHDWPYNVRELLATARDLTASGSKTVPLDAPDFRRRVGALSTSPNPRRLTPVSAVRARDGLALSRDDLSKLLAEAGGTVSEVARLVGRSRRQVYRWIEKYEIRVQDFRR